MAKVIVVPGQDLREIARRAGGDPNLTLFDPDTNELEVTDVTQAELDAAFADYSTNQVAIDAAIVAANLVKFRDKTISELDDLEALPRSLLLMFGDELNALEDKVNTIRLAIETANTVGQIQAALAAIPDLPRPTSQERIDAARAKLGS